MAKKLPKEPVRLRRKALSSGGASLYLDFYTGGTRRYEFLKLYLVPEHNKADRDRNRETLRLAEVVRARRVVECQRQAAGLATAKRVPLAEWMRECGRGKSAATAKLWECAIRRVAMCSTPGMCVQDVDAAWLRRLLESLDDLAPNTRAVYWSKVRAAMGRAEKAGMVARDPCRAVDTPRLVETRREHLDLEELRRLASAPAPARHAEVRRAFLFSCLTGLRVSDIRALVWEEVAREQGRARLVFRQRKTGGMEYLDLSAQAASLLGERGEPSQPVFALPPSSASLNYKLSAWARAAGIGKHITFHCARHTFAVLQLASGTDIYTVSKLLGHADVGTTQVYAKVLDRAKREAVDRMPEVL